MISFFVLQRHPRRYVKKDGTMTDNAVEAAMKIDECFALYKEKSSRVPFLKIIHIRMTAWQETDFTSYAEGPDRDGEP